MTITREIVIDEHGSPIWRICSGGICVECASGTQAASVIDAFEASQGHGLTRHPSLGKPERGPDMVPDPGV